MHAVIAGDMEWEDLFAEIHHGDSQWAEINNDPNGGISVVEIFAPGSGDGYLFDLQEMQKAVGGGERRLAELDYPEEKETPSG